MYLFHKGGFLNGHPDSEAGCNIDFKLNFAYNSFQVHNYLKLFLHKIPELFLKQNIYHLQLHISN